MGALITSQPAVNSNEAILTSIDANPALQPATRLQYKKAIMRYLQTGNGLTDAEALAQYAVGLPRSSRAFLKAAVRLWSEQVALQAKAGATPQNIAAIQATVYRLEALNRAIQVEAVNGQKAHNWLTQAEVKQLLATANHRTLKGRRDGIVLGLLVGAGLRREELATLRFEDITVQPVTDKPRTVLNVTGKGAKDRVVPISNHLATALTAWRETCGGEGYIARRITKGGKLGERLSAVGIFHIVSTAGKAIGKPALAPHDLRRTYARTGYDAGVDIGQISTLLGHANIATTQKYLGLQVNLTATISDFVPLDSLLP